MPSSKFITAFWILTALSVIAGLALSAWYAPVDPELGPAQKILYLHVPVAMMMYVACGMVFAASLAHLWQRTARSDALAGAAAELAVLYASIALITGMCWARDAWGHWWVWSPRLSLSLVLWILYSGYLLTRRLSRPKAAACAFYGVVAFLDVPLVYLSVKLLPDIHPTRVTLSWEMRATLAFWFIPIVLLSLGMLWTRFVLLSSSQEDIQRGAHGDVMAITNPAKRTGISSSPQ